MSAGQLLKNLVTVQKRLSEAAKKRLQAGQMLLAGKGPAEVALAVGVARQTVYTCKGLLDEGGIDALRAVPERGRPAQLDAAQLASIRAVVLQKPTEHGFGTDLWTLKRVGRLIVFIDDLAQAPRIGQLLSRRPQRIAHHRAQQVQERPKAPFDHRRLLEARYPLVMS